MIDPYWTGPPPPPPPTTTTSEYCIDYDPSGAVLWLVTGGGWYRLTGENYYHLKPHDFYAPVFHR